MPTALDRVCGVHLNDGRPLEQVLSADECERIVEAVAPSMSVLVKMLQECADDLADMIEGHYAATKDHPAMKKRYDRDMDPVIRARAEIVKATGAKP